MNSNSRTDGLSLNMYHKRCYKVNDLCYSDKIFEKKNKQKPVEKGIKGTQESLKEPVAENWREVH